MSLRLAARAALLPVLCLFGAMAGANAQNAGSNLQEVQVADGAFSLGDPVPSWVEPVAMPDADPSRPVVIRLSDTQWRVDSTPVIYTRRAVMINDAASLNAAGQLSIQFVPQYQRLQLHAIRVLRGDKSEDRTSSSTIRFLQRETGLEHGVYSGVVTASILVNDLRAGDTVELSYSLYGQNPVFGGKFVGIAIWDQGYPALLRRLVLSYPAARRINWRLIDDARSRGLVPQETTRDGWRRLYFEEKSMPEVGGVQFAPADYSVLALLQFSEFSGWNDVANWASELFQITGINDDETRAVVEKLRKLPDDEQRAAAALQFVQSEIRYFSVALGESSHRPTPPDIVLQRRYGDCKDKSLLLMSLLKELGIRSEPVLLKFGRRKGLDKFLPSPQVFDHVIVRADLGDKTFYLDPTRLGQHGRLDRMGQLHEGSEVLVVAPGTRQLSTLVSPNAFDLVRGERSEIAALPKLGPAGTLQTRQTWNGLGAETIRLVIERLSHAQLDKVIGDEMNARYPGAKLSGEPDVEDDRVNDVVTISAVYDVPQLATEKDGNWFVLYNPVNLKGALLPTPPPGRTAPLIVRAYPFDGRYTFEARFPEQVSALSDPYSASVDAKQFTYAVTSSFRGNVFKTEIDLKTNADRVEAPDLKKYGDDTREANGLSRGVVLVTKQQIKSPTASGGDSFAQSLRDRAQDAIDKISKTIDSGKLTGHDLATAYCARSEEYSSLGMANEAIRDAGEAVKLAPNDGKFFGCRADAYYQSGAFDKSLADYSNAIVFGATEAGVFRGRGVCEFYAGKLDSAAEDFAKASAAADKDAATYIDLWLMWTLERLGKPIPDRVIKEAAADARGDWPRPALAMQAGDITPEAMLASLDGKTGDDRQMALAEAYFDLGEHYLGLGDKAKARAFFEKTRQLQVINFIEHVAAGFELKSLVEANSLQAPLASGLNPRR